MVNDKTKDLILNIHEVMKVLGDDDYDRKSIWIKITRGPIETFGDYNECKKAGEVSNRKEFEEWWLDAFPEEVAWFKLFTDHYQGKYWVDLSDRGQHATLMFDPESKDYNRLDLSHIAEILLEIVKREVAAVVADVDGYNRYLNDNLPYNRRNGKIKRSIYNSIYPDEKVVVKEKYLPMLRYLATNTDSYFAKGRIGVMTVREYLKIWRLAVEAMNDTTRDDSISDVEFFESKNFHGSTLLEYDIDSPKAFAEWNSLSDNWAYHRLDLQYRTITFITRNDDSGWWFIVRADSLHMKETFLRIVNALYSAGIPVNLSSVKQLVAMIDERDFVGIQPSYNHKYNTIYDGEIGNYTSLGDEKDAEVIANADWDLPDEIRLKQNLL